MHKGNFLHLCKIPVGPKGPPRRSGPLGARGGDPKIAKHEGNSPYIYVCIYVCMYINIYICI